MEIVFHPLVRRDIQQPIQYYKTISDQLAQEFRSELKEVLDQVTRNPLRFHITDRGFRRANFQRFPYHLLYDVTADHVRVMLLRHNKRNPQYGLKRF
jgi:toxin ParE1/3/4